MKSKKKLKANLFLLFISLVVIILIAYISIAIFFPSNITIRSGETSLLDFNLPLQGNLFSQDTAVSVNSDEPVKNNISLDLNAPILLKAENAGKALLKLSFFGVPIKNSTITVLPDISLYPGGQAIGLELDTDGVLVLGTGEVRLSSGKYESPCRGILKSGDLIQKADNVTLTDKESLINYIENCNTTNVKLTVERNEEIITVDVVPVVSSESRKKKLGIWVRDSTQGIGTLTCYDSNGNFYALGHPVTDVDTGNIMKIRDGKLMPTEITSVNKGEKGSPGELVGNTDKEKIIGDVTKNNQCGIAGNIYFNPPSDAKSYEIALKNEVKEGDATILVTVNGTEVRPYNIKIESTGSLSSDKSKAMTIQIIDNDLIEKTGGIVQGMSGAPIIQNGKLVGAVTHVFIQNPTKGYAIYIEDMLNS